MPDRTKIATCSYCGTRSMLVPSARDGHELACAACGAPLHEMKWLKSPDKPRKAKPKKYHSKSSHRYDEAPRRPRRKKRKATWKKAVEEAFDLLEDIFD